MHNIDISFITLSYNKFCQLNQTVKSIIDNTIDLTYEIIIMDNNSSEGDIFNEIIPNERIKLIKNNENQGWPKAINESIIKAKGKYICIVDNDVIFIENSAKIMLDYCKSLKEDVIVGPRLLNPDMMNQTSISNLKTPAGNFFQAFFLNVIFPESPLFNCEYMNYKKIEKPTQVELLKGACLFFKRQVFDSLYGFDKNLFFYASDYDFCWRFNKNGGKVIFNPETKVIHLGGVSRSTAVFSGYDNDALDMIKFNKKHFTLIDRILIYCFIGLGLIIRIPLWFALGVFTLDKFKIQKSYFQFIQLFFHIKGVLFNH